MFFKKKKIDVIPGEKYVFRGNTKDPFPPKKNQDHVIEVYKGWVRYEFIKGSCFKDERLEIKMFNHIYKKS